MPYNASVSHTYKIKNKTKKGKNKEKIERKIELN